MTNEEAKEILSKINIAVSCGATPILLENEIVEATSMAIQALEDKGYEQGYKDGYLKGYEEGVVLG